MTSQGRLSLSFAIDGVDDAGWHVLGVDHAARMSQPHRTEVELAVPEGRGLRLVDLAGQAATLTMAHPTCEPRHIRGVVTEVAELASTDGWDTFRLVVRPPLWLASLVETCEIHLDADVPSIVKARLAEVGVAPELRLTGQYPVREMVTQYRESVLAFVSRLCEHLGVFHFVEAGEDEDRLVLGDDASSYARPADEEVRFVGRSDGIGVHELVEHVGLVPALYVCRDHDERAPLLDVVGEHELDGGFAGGVVEYGNHARTEAQARALARVRAEERRAQHQGFRGTSTDLRLAPGHTFQLLDHPRHAGRFVVVSEEIEVRRPMFDGAAGAEPATHRGSFTAIRAETTYRPPRVTPIPRVHGLVTGLVESTARSVASHAKIDAEGRYGVAFFFDPTAPGRARVSAPVRMAQPSAGPGYGVHFPLKPGVEVVVAFVDGNVDRPVIVGAVPNPLTASPVVADASTTSRIQTRSGILIEFDDADRRA